MRAIIMKLYLNWGT